MPSQVLSGVENNFTKGLLTEFTGLNFPENAATDADNVVFTLVGDVTRRLGIDVEQRNSVNPISTNNWAISTYKWNNVGGDGETQIVVVQVGLFLYFYQSSSTTEFSPLSSTLLGSTVTVSSFQASGATFRPGVECQFTDGNGYLFVYHPDCEPFYCTYTSGVIAGTIISLQIRDFTGVSEGGLPVNTRPNSLTQEHLYNLSNQGWTQGNPWLAVASNSVTVNTGNISFTVASGISGITNGTGVSIYNNSPITPGSSPTIPAGTIIMAGNVASYSGTTLVITVTYYLSELFLNNTSGTLNIIPTDAGFINTWTTDIGNYPSNSDVWWYFKDNTDVFNPTTTISNVNFNLGQAPQGHFVLPAFNQNRSATSGIAGLTQISTATRPTNGTWFQGRVWFTGVNAQVPASGDANYYTWTENIYFSQVVTGPTNFGNCYQVNDPTSEVLNGLLPTDGGVITVQGSGAIYKLFPIANGMIVFAANGVWFITGSQGIGFSADDYTITKLSAIKCLSSYSFVDVNGLPYFWNEEGIYAVEPQQGGSLTVNPITVGTILTFYNSIPLVSKQYARAAYDPINYFIQWIYKSTAETNITDRYSYDRVLNYSTWNKAFYTYSVNNTLMSVGSIIYVSSPGGIDAAESTIKFFAIGSAGVTFAEEYDPSYVDWLSKGGINYDSYFVTGYKLHGQGQRRFQMPYIYMYSRNDQPTSYNIQGLWDYAITGNSGRWSALQQVNTFNPNFGMTIRRHRIRGRGLVLQLKVTSTDGMPFDIMGWSTFETSNTGV